MNYRRQSAFLLKRGTQMVLGKFLEVEHYCIRFPTDNQLNAPLLKVVGGKAPDGHVRAINIETGDEVHIGMEDPMLVIHL